MRCCQIPPSWLYTACLDIVKPPCYCVPFGSYSQHFDPTPTSAQSIASISPHTLCFNNIFSVGQTLNAWRPLSSYVMVFFYSISTIISITQLEHDFVEHTYTNMNTASPLILWKRAIQNWIDSLANNWGALTCLMFKLVCVKNPLTYVLQKMRSKLHAGPCYCVSVCVCFCESILNERSRLT